MSSLFPRPTVPKKYRTTHCEPYETRTQENIFEVFFMCDMSLCPRVERLVLIILFLFIITVACSLGFTKWRTSTVIYFVVQQTDIELVILIGTNRDEKASFAFGISR